MKTCDACKVVVDEELLFCPKCGQSLRNGTDDDLSRAVSQLLAEASLNRTKGELDAALDKCTEALKLMPDNPDTYSLLGDIYESKGNFEEAVKWYQMAIDIKPKSSLDAAKLEQVEALLQKSRQERMENITGGWLLGDTKRNTSLSRIVSFSVIAVLVLAVFGMTSLFMKYRAEQSKPAEKPPHTEQTAVKHQEEMQTPPPPTSTEADPQVIARPIAEQRILTSLATNPAILSHKLIMEDVRFDPRTEVLTLTIRLSGSKKPLTRASMLKYAAIAASATFAASPSTARVEIRSLVEYQTKISPREPKLELITDVTRHISGLDLSHVSAKQLEKSFARTWWGPELPQ
ncbi:MAG: tetratricopeptide repeat protein [Armatimonadota bacterium]